MIEERIQRAPSGVVQEAAQGIQRVAGDNPELVKSADVGSIVRTYLGLAAQAAQHELDTLKEKVAPKHPKS